MRPGDLDDPTPVEPDDARLERVHARSGTFRRRRRAQRLTGAGAGALVVVLAVAIAIPVVDDRTEPARPTDITTTTQPRVTAELEGEWRPVSIAGYTGPLTSPPLSDVPLLRFTNDEIVGNDGCNGFSTSYEMGDDGSVRAGQIRTELQLCPGAPPLRNAVAETTRIEHDAKRLTLRDADGRELAVLRPAGVTARIELPADTMVAGTEMEGHVVVDNQTGHEIKASGCNSLFQVALRSESYEPMLGWLDCLQEFVIPMGVSRYPVSVSAHALGCLDCGGRVPTLEPGRFEATLYQRDHIVPDPPPIPMQVTAPSTTSVTARIEVPAVPMVAGTTMRGTVIVQNDTGAARHGSGCGNFFQVLLVNDTVQQAPGWRQCLEQFTFPVGESRHPVTISASYNACVREASDRFPTCVPGGGPPPLPPGTYRATLFQSDDIVPGRISVPIQVIAAP